MPNYRYHFLTRSNLRPQGGAAPQNLSAAWNGKRSTGKAFQLLGANLYICQAVVVSTR